ncbi:unnamed protein product [Prorocentrum cordatum]|uniref:Secreted protein n=1 Tax=Prorocentrum cordatum TaxID=2364126 RepID=A0ABN9Y9L6_9DINO|nr:unnamed protein product [Polarella glacialis]
MILMLMMLMRMRLMMLWLPCCMSSRALGTSAASMEANPLFDNSSSTLSCGASSSRASLSASIAGATGTTSRGSGRSPGNRTASDRRQGKQCVNIFKNPHARSLAPERVGHSSRKYEEDDIVPMDSADGPHGDGSCKGLFVSSELFRRGPDAHFVGATRPWWRYKSITCPKTAWPTCSIVLKTLDGAGSGRQCAALATKRARRQVSPSPRRLAFWSRQRLRGLLPSLLTG